MNSTGYIRFKTASIAACLGLALFAGGAAAAQYRIDEVRPLYIKIDKNADGVISRKELRDEDPGLLSGFRKADIDRNGRLTLRELELLLISI